MKIALLVLPVALLAAGCADTPRSGPAEWGYKPGERAPQIISESEFESLTAQVTDLKAQRATLADIARTSPDAARRAESARSVDDVNRKIQMLEYRLRAANRPVPRG